MKRKVGLIVGLILIGLIAERPIGFHADVSFGSLQDAANRIRTLSYTCCSDMSTGRIVSGFMVSKEPATWMDANELCKGGPMNAAWTNRVWVKKVPRGALFVIPDECGTRVWGGVFAFGDPAFLDEIDKRLRR